MTIKSLDVPQDEINSTITLFSNGHTQEALDSVRTLIKDYPNEPILFNICGACYASLGQLDKAVRNYENSIAIKPDYAEAHNNLAGTFQELGQLDQAVERYRKSLVIKPNYAEAHNNLGNALRELNQLESAIKSYQMAIDIKPDYVEAHYSLGIIYQELNQLESAIKSYQKAIDIKPDYVEAHYSLGIIYQELNQLESAIKSYQMAIDIKPDYVEAHYSLGIIYQELNQLESAIKSYQKAIDIKPDYVEAHNNLGVTFKELGQHEVAVKCYKKALGVNPDFAEAHNNLGVTFKELDQYEVAVKSFERALTLKPDYTEALLNLGNVLKTLGQLDAAVKSYEKALEIDPNFVDTYNNLGITYMDLGQNDKAIKYYEKALAINPNFADAHNNLGIVLNILDQQSKAEKSYKKAIAIKPDFAAAHLNLAELLTNLKKFDEAILSYEYAINLDPDEGFALGSFLHTKMHLCIWKDLSIHLKEIIEKINSRKKIIEPFPLLALIDDPEIQWKATEIFAKQKFPQNIGLSKIERKPKNSKIRIGYFSADFREHPVATLTAELYEIHDRNQFEVYAFSFGPDTKDEMNLRIKAGVDHFCDVRTMSHKEVAMLSRSVEIDIAVDLGGFTQAARTGIFAMQVAPIQVNYLGYSGTMGASYMDYLIADHTLIPKDSQQHYSEKIVYLPNSFMVNDTKNKLSNRVFTRSEARLPTNGFVFCCFNNHYKITPNIFIGWMRILSKVDGSVLWLSEGNSTAVNNLKKEAKKNGVDENRIIFASRLTLREDHLNRIQLADLFLDTMPYNAHATTSDALQVGLPVLTCIGNSFSSRVAASLINSVNLPELITNTQEQYESLAIQLAKNPEKLKTIKEKLNNNLIKSPLYNTPLYVKHLESAYRTMYNRFHQELEPDHIHVEH